MNRAGTVFANIMLGVAAAVAQQKDASTADLHVAGDGREETLRCHGNAVFITGNAGRFTIEGKCTTVHVGGSRNWIEVQDADWIRTEGNLNSVLYLNPNTRVADPGKGNSVSSKWQQ